MTKPLKQLNGSLETFNFCRLVGVYRVRCGCAIIQKCLLRRVHPMQFGWVNLPFSYIVLGR